MNSIINIRQKLRFIWNLINTYLFYFTNKIIRAKFRGIYNEPFILFDIHSRISERQYAYLLFSINMLNYNILVINNIHFIGNLNTYSNHILSLRNIKLINRYPAGGNCLLLITDELNTDSHSKYKKKLKLDSSIIKNCKIRHSSELLPFYMIPRMYFSNSFLKSKKLQTRNDRTMRIFFSGNVDPTQYNNSKFKKTFNKLTRIEILNTLKKMIDQMVIITLEDVPDSAYANGRSNIVLSEWVRNSPKQSNIVGRIDNNNWLEELSRSDFFLACPGYIQPMCHNVVEAISVGSIPILEHPELFNPPLEDNVNAIVFKGKENLVNRLNEVLNMNEDEVLSLRRNVTNYYNDYLDPESVVNSFLNLEDGQTNKYFIESAYFEQYADQGSPITS